MITNKNLIALLFEIQKNCAIATSMEDVNVNAVIEDIRTHVETALYLAKTFGRPDVVALCRSGQCCIIEGDGWPVEGKNVQPCIDKPYWYAHGTTTFDIRNLRRILDFNKTEYAGDLKLTRGATRWIICDFITAAMMKERTLTDATNEAAIWSKF